MATVTRDVPVDVVICEYHEEDVEAVDTVGITADGKRYKADVCQACKDEIVGPARPAAPRRRARRKPAARQQGRKRAAGRARAAAKSSNGNGNGHRTRKPRTRKVESSELRQWARDNGYQVADKGRVPTDVVTAWNESVKA